MATLRDDVFLGEANWYRQEMVQPVSYVCGFCGERVASDRGYSAGLQADGSGARVAFIRICPSCDGPTVFTRSEKQLPGPLPGSEVEHVPQSLAQLYAEARLSSSASAYTAAVMVCRKMLMNIAVDKGAGIGLSFLQCVQYLADKGFVPPGGDVWVDYIRKRGNEATHEIALMQQEDAVALIRFVEMLLRFIYEFPQLAPSVPAVK